jgi:hypothetical protein
VPYVPGERLREVGKRGATAYCPQLRGVVPQPQAVPLLSAGLAPSLFSARHTRANKERNL